MSEADYVDIIARVGFPIGMCLLVYLDLRKQVAALTDSVKALLNKMS